MVLCIWEWTGLCISDSLKLSNDFLYFIMLVISQHNRPAATAMMVNVYPYAHYVMQVALSVTAWLTVSVAFDRYVSVCFPQRAKSLCTIVRARTVVGSVFTTMILLSIPSVFRYRLETVHDETNNVTCMHLVLTELGRNSQFMSPYTWIHNLLRGIIPVFILIFLNARIINVLRKERVKGKKFSSRNRITLMLIAMIVIFIVCITPDAIMSTFFGKGYVEEGNMVKGVREITDSLVTFNSAVNFILYCSLSVMFRNTFARIFLGPNFVRNKSGSCRHASSYAGGGCEGEGVGRRKSGTRTSVKMKYADYAEISQESPPNGKSKKSRSSKKANAERNNSDKRLSIPDNSGVWLGYDTYLAYERSGGVWLGPVTNDYNKSTESEDTNDNSSSDRRTSASAGSKSDTCSTSRPELSSNGNSTSGGYPGTDSSDKGWTMDGIDETPPTTEFGLCNEIESKGFYENINNMHQPKNGGTKKPPRRLAWKFDQHSPKDPSPTIIEPSSNQSHCRNLNENGRSNYFTRDNFSGKDGSLLPCTFTDISSEIS